MRATWRRTLGSVIQAQQDCTEIDPQPAREISTMGLKQGKMESEGEAQGKWQGNMFCWGVVFLRTRLLDALAVSGRSECSDSGLGSQGKALASVSRYFGCARGHACQGVNDNQVREDGVVLPGLCLRDLERQVDQGD